ncbi:MAG: methylenetetrahydrofolate reductase [bacterium]
MNLKNKLASGKGAIILEVSPPKGVTTSRIIDEIAPLIPYTDAFSIPENPRGRARMDPLAFGHIVREQTQKEVVLHITCRDKNIIALQSELLGAYALGMRNLLLLTGDPPSPGDYPSAKAVFDVTSEGLISIANRMREGTDLSGRELGEKLDFFIGAGFNPCTRDENEIQKTLRKISLGVDFLVSQPIFSLQRWDEFTSKLPKGVFLIGGVWILKSLRMANFLNNEVPGVFVPEEVMERMEKASDERAEGIRIAKEIALALLKRGMGIMLMTGNDFQIAKEFFEAINEGV